MKEEQNYKVIIVGGGTGGIAVASRLARRFPAGSVAVFEPSLSHYYQPLWTLVGAGICSLEESRRSTEEFIPAGVTWIREKVMSFQPADNKLTAESGQFSYDALVLSPGIQVNWDGIEGLRDTLGKNNVVSNYSEDVVEKTWESFQSFSGGRAIFTFPATPIKCGGAPQKIMYLMDDYLRRQGLRDKSSVEFMSAADSIFAVPKYKEALDELIARRGIRTHFKRNLIAVDGARKVAVFKDLETNAEHEESFDFLHVTPPMSAPNFIKESELSNQAGWIDVDKHSLQHNKFANVFALGDASSLPTSRTGAAIRKQAPTLVENLCAHLSGAPLSAKYDGYTSCPIVTGYGKLILAEFDYDSKPCETFPFNQAKERWSMYQLKRHVLPVMYWQGMMRGRA